jgi:hypothetical protein
VIKVEILKVFIKGKFSDSYIETDNEPSKVNYAKISLFKPAFDKN